MKKKMVVITGVVILAGTVMFTKFLKRAAVSALQNNLNNLKLKK